LETFSFIDIQLSFTYIQFTRSEFLAFDVSNVNSAIVKLRKGHSMSRLRDYSGQLNPNIKLEDFSKDVLAQMVKMYGKMYLAVDGFWYLSVKEKVNNDMALACDFWVWGKQCKNVRGLLTESRFGSLR
jgi:hypothetical protein